MHDSLQVVPKQQPERGSSKAVASKQKVENSSELIMMVLEYSAVCDALLCVGA